MASSAAAAGGRAAHVSRAGDHAEHRVPGGFAHRHGGSHVVGSEMGPREAADDGRGGQVGHGRPERHRGVARVPGAGAPRAATSAAAAADHGGHRSGRRRQGVGGDQRGLVGGVRQPGGEGGEHEPVDREDGQPGRVEAGALDAAEDQRRDDGDQAGPHHVGPQQHLPPAPAVEPDPGERADEGVGQQEDGEPGGDVDGVGGPLRVEQHRAGQRGLEDAVAELCEQPGAEQPAEVAVGTGGGGSSSPPAATRSP